MNTTEVLRVTGIPRQKLYYLEQKGYIRPRKVHVGEKAFREFSEADVRLIHWIWVYLKDGFRYRVAYEKALRHVSEGSNGGEERELRDWEGVKGVKGNE